MESQLSATLKLLLNQRDVFAVIEQFTGIVKLAHGPGYTSAEALHLLYEGGFLLKFLDQIFGEHNNFAVQGTEASVWWYAVDDCPVRAFLDSGRRSPPAGPLRVKCEAAVRLQELFLPTPDVSSLFADRAPPLLPFRRELLPTTTQRILAAAGGFAPPLSNELQVVDPLLYYLLNRYRTAGRPLLPDPPSAAGGPAPLPMRDILRLGLTDVLLLYIARFPASTTRKRPVEKTAAAAHAAFRVTSQPLAYTALDDVVDSRPFFDLLFALLDVHLLPTDAPPAAPETSGVFLAAIESYWFLQNPPSLVPLPHQPPPLPWAPLGVPLRASDAQAWGAGGGGWDAGLSGGAGRFGPTGVSAAVRGPALSAQQAYEQFATSGGAAAAAGTPTQAAEYVLPTLEVVHAVFLLVTTQMCDRTFLPCVAGTLQPPSGGRALSRLASIALQGDATAVPEARAEAAALMGRRALLPGMLSLPVVWCELVQPAFSFVRVNLELHPMGAAMPPAPPSRDAQRVVDWNAARYLAVADVWLAVLTPWRARPRLKHVVVTPPAVSRAFPFAEAVAEAVRSAAAAASSRGSGAGGVDLAMISQMVRDSQAYRARVRACHDFESHLLTDTPSAGYAPPGNVSLVSAADWASWLGTHYAFYVFVFGRVLRRLKAAAFLPEAADAGLRVGPLALLERVLDVYEPVVVQRLKALSAVARATFVQPLSHVASGQDRSSFADSAAAAAPQQGPEFWAMRMQLLAHCTLLRLPPGTPAGAVLVPWEALRADAAEVAKSLQIALALAPRPALPPDVACLLAEGLASGAAAAAALPRDLAAPPAVSSLRDVAGLARWAGRRAGSGAWAGVLWLDEALGFTLPTARSGAAADPAASAGAAAAADRLQLVHDRLCLVFDLPLPVLSVLATGPPAAGQPLVPGVTTGGALLPPGGGGWSIAALLLWLGQLISLAAVLRVCQALVLAAVAAVTGLRPVPVAGVAALHASLAPETGVGTISAGPRKGQRIGLLTPDGRTALLTGNAKWTPAQLAYSMPAYALPPQRYESTLLLTVTGSTAWAIFSCAARAQTSFVSLLRAIGLVARGNPSASHGHKQAPRRLSLSGVTMATSTTGGSEESLRHDAEARALQLLRKNFLRPLADVRVLSVLFCAAAVWVGAWYYGDLGAVPSTVVAAIASTIVVSSWF